MKNITVTTLRGECVDDVTCPGIHSVNVDPEGRYIVAATVTDAAILDVFASRLGPGEILVRLPATLLPEV